MPFTNLSPALEELPSALPSPAADIKVRGTLCTGELEGFLGQLLGNAGQGKEALVLG